MCKSLYCYVHYFIKKTRYVGCQNSSPVGFATTTDRPSVAAAFKTNCSGESEKCSVDINVLCSDSDVSTEHIVCDSQECADTIIKRGKFL